MRVYEYIEAHGPVAVGTPVYSAYYSGWTWDYTLGIVSAVTPSGQLTVSFSNGSTERYTARGRRVGETGGRRHELDFDVARVAAEIKARNLSRRLHKAIGEVLDTRRSDCDAGKDAHAATIATLRQKLEAAEAILAEQSPGNDAALALAAGEKG